MAYYTGPDFRTGVPGLINNTTDTTTKTTDPDTRYGERIGDDGYLRTGPFTTDFLDSDGDGIDDRQQAGAGQPEIGSNLDGSPIFGIDNPPPFISQQTGGEGDVLGQFPGVQGQNDPLNPANNQRYSYESYNGKTFKVDNITGEVEEFNGFLGTAGILGSIIGNFRNIRNAPPNVQAAYSDALSRDQRGVDLDKRDPTNAETYGIGETEDGLQVREDSLYERLKNLGRDDLTGEGTEETTEEATIAAYNRQKEIAEATKKATEQRIAREKKQALQDARDLQKQAEKDRQAREKRNQAERDKRNKTGATDKTTGLDKNREAQKAKDKAQRDKQKGGNPNRGEKNAGRGGFNSGGR